MSPGVGSVREDAEARPRTDDPVQLLDGPPCCDSGICWIV